MWSALLRAHASLHPSYQMDGAPEAALAEAFEGELHDPRAVVLVAESGPSGERAQGFCVARSAPAPGPIREAARGSLDEVWVAPGHRRRGVGRQLVVGALGALRTAGVARVEVRVLHANPDAREFWQALGFGPFVEVLERRL